MLTYPQSEHNTRIKRFQVIPFEQAVAKIRVAAEATKTAVGEGWFLQVHFGDLKTPVFGGSTTEDIWKYSATTLLISLACDCCKRQLHGWVMIACGSEKNMKRPNIISTNRPFHMPYMQAGRRTQDPSKRCYDSRQTYIHRLFQPSRLAGLTNSFQHVGLCMYMMKLSLNQSVILCWYFVDFACITYILWLHILYFHIYMFLFVCAFPMNDFRFYLHLFSTSKARSSPDFLIIARTDARTTLGVKPVVGLSTWIYTDGTYDTAFLSDVVICDALFHHFSIFFQCFIISYFVLDASLVANLKQAWAWCVWNEHGWFTSLRTFPIFVARPGGSLTTCPCICSCRGWYSLRGSARVGGAHRGNPAANRRLHRRFVVGKLTSGRDGYDLQFFGRHW